MPLWRERLARIARPRVLISAFLATSAFYCFVIGRDRYTSVSEFVIQQAAPLNTSSASVLAGAAAALLRWFLVIVVPTLLSPPPQTGSRAAKSR